ncbi:MAG: class A beta-lactamase-related serine hydrolase [Lachnospiraceae bacterium]|nr:class A beta-lactamase-related serine hydrolase [Lachnospiraceae bacterium]
MTKQEVNTYFEEQAAAFPGKVAYLYASMEQAEEADVLTDCEMTPGHIFSAHGEERVVSASTVKVPVMMALLERLEKEHIPVQTKISVKAEQILEDSRVFEYGPREASFEELIVWMIVNSDNTSTNVLLQYLGFDAYNQYFRKIGLRETKVERLMLDFEAVEAGYNNYISPMDYYRCMLLLWQNRNQDPKAKLALDILKRNRDYDSLCRYLYEGPVVAHKSGGLDDIVHDAGIFWMQKSNYFLGVFVSEFKPEQKMEKEAEKLVGRLSRKVYDLELEQEA